jgi:preprotein translocase subunit YajC
MILLQNITTTTATTGTATAAPGAGAPPPSGMPSWVTFFPLLIMVPFLFMTFRRQKKEEEARSSLKKGDKVVVGGIVGEYQEMDGRLAKVKIANGVLISAVASALSPFEVKPAEDPLKDLKEAKGDGKDAKLAAEKK